MRLEDVLRETYAALMANKIRSGLTILGIVIGIGSVVAMISIGQGAAGNIQSSIESLGSNLLLVSPGASQSGRGFVSSGRGGAKTLKNTDAEALASIDEIAHISPEFQNRFQIVAPNGNNTNSTVVGVTSNYALVRNFTVASGSFLTDQQNNNRSRVAVLGSATAEDLFGEDDPVGKTIRVNKINFKVVGVLETKGGSGFFNPDDTMLVPLTTMQKVLANVDYLSQIAISVVGKSEMPTVKEEVTAELLIRHKLDESSADFTVTSQEDILSSLTEVTNTLTVFLAAIAGISLVVGGIGIMNMMLTTVTERTREIGLRKAIGARSRDISFQFLTEAVVLTFVGGVIGVALGWLAAILITKFSGTNTIVSWGSVLLAFSVSAMIGIVFGYYPAKRAASLRPIEALRYE